jgi:hypothetical protein
MVAEPDDIFQFLKANNIGNISNFQQFPLHDIFLARFFLLANAHALILSA